MNLDYSRSLCIEGSAEKIKDKGAALVEEEQESREKEKETRERRIEVRVSIAKS